MIFVFPLFQLQLTFKICLLLSKKLMHKEFHFWLFSDKYLIKVRNLCMFVRMLQPLHMDYLFVLTCGQKTVFSDIFAVLIDLFYQYHL